MMSKQVNDLLVHMICTASLIEWVANGAPDNNQATSFGAEVYDRHFPAEGGPIELDELRRRLKAFLSEAIERL